MRWRTFVVKLQAQSFQFAIETTVYVTIFGNFIVKHTPVVYFEYLLLTKDFSSTYRVMYLKSNFAKSQKTIEDFNISHIFR